MKDLDDEIDVEVNISRYQGASDGGDEITITVTIPATATEAKRRFYITLTPADFALALTGRGGIKGRMSEFVFKATRKVKP